MIDLNISFLLVKSLKIKFLPIRIESLMKPLSNFFQTFYWEWKSKEPPTYCTVKFKEPNKQY